ncbi:MAG: DUF423 domain-containing protein [Bacteroidota bacterium]
MRKRFIRLGSLLAFLAVILGAFGAHGLEGKITPDQIDTFKTGVEYQFFHAFAILIVALLIHYRKTSFLPLSAWTFFIGILLFSGSLYAFTFFAFFDLAAPVWIGPITPLGGTLFIVGWGLLFLSTFQQSTYVKKDK